MTAEEATPSLSQAQRLKRYSQEGKLSEDVMSAIMSEEKKEVDRIFLTSDKLKQYFPKSYTPRQMEETIFKLLEQWQQKRERDMERWYKKGAHGSALKIAFFELAHILVQFSGASAFFPCRFFMFP